MNTWKATTENMTQYALEELSGELLYDDVKPLLALNLPYDQLVSELKDLMEMHEFENFDKEHRSNYDELALINWNEVVSKLEITV